jgi:hypothetical protein
MSSDVESDVEDQEEESDFEDEDEDEDEDDEEEEEDDEDQEDQELADEQEAEEEADETYIPHINLFGTPRLANLFREALESEYTLTISGKSFVAFVIIIAVAILVSIACTV